MKIIFYLSAVLLNSVFILLSRPAFSLIGANQSLDQQLLLTKQVALYLDDNLICGSTLVFDNIVLTAGHCLKNIENKKIILKYQGNEYSMSLTDQNMVIHNKLDLGLLFLPFNLGLAPVRKIVKKDNIPLRFLAVGFGCQSFLLIGQEWVFEQSTDLAAAYLKNVQARENYYEWNSKVFDGTLPSLCPGDSGSGLFVQAPNNDLLLAAVNSSIGLEEAFRDGISRATRIDNLEIENWIQYFIQQHKKN